MSGLFDSDFERLGNPFEGPITIESLVAGSLRELQAAAQSASAAYENYCEDARVRDQIGQDFGKKMNPLAAGGIVSSASQQEINHQTRQIAEVMGSSQQILHAQVSQEENAAYVDRITRPSTGVEPQSQADIARMFVEQAISPLDDDFTLAA